MKDEAIIKAALKLIFFGYLALATAYLWTWCFFWMSCPSDKLYLLGYLGFMLTLGMWLYFGFCVARRLRSHYEHPSLKQD